MSASARSSKRETYGKPYRGRHCPFALRLLVLGHDTARAVLAGRSHESGDRSQKSGARRLMRSTDWLQLAAFVAGVALLTKPMGLYLVQVLDAHGRTWLDPLFKPLERLTYRLMGVKP